MGVDGGERICPACGATAFEKPFCPHCGHRLDAESQPALTDSEPERSRFGRAPSRKPLLALGVILALLLVYAAIAAVSSGDEIPFCCGGEDPQSTGLIGAQLPTEPSPERITDAIADDFVSAQRDFPISTISDYGCDPYGKNDKFSCWIRSPLTSTGIQNWVGGYVLAPGARYCWVQLEPLTRTKVRGCTDVVGAPATESSAGEVVECGTDGDYSYSGSGLDCSTIIQYGQMAIANQTPITDEKLPDGWSVGDCIFDDQGFPTCSRGAESFSVSFGASK